MLHSLCFRKKMIDRLGFVLRICFRIKTIQLRRFPFDSEISFEGRWILLKIATEKHLILDMRVIRLIAMHVSNVINTVGAKLFKITSAGNSVFSFWTKSLRFKNGGIGIDNRYIFYQNHHIDDRLRPHTFDSGRAEMKNRNFRSFQKLVQPATERFESLFPSGIIWNNRHFSFHKTAFRTNKIFDEKQRTSKKSSVFMARPARLELTTLRIGI